MRRKTEGVISLSSCTEVSIEVGERETESSQKNSPITREKLLVLAKEATAVLRVIWANVGTGAATCLKQ